MSTILDALRKLQRERAAQHPSRDLRGSVTDEIPAQRAQVRSGRRGLVAGLAVLLLAVAGGGFWLVRGGHLPGLGARGTATDESLEQADSDDRPATDEELAQLERETLAQESEMDRATAAEPEPPAPVAASPAPVEPAPAAGAPPGAPIDAEAEAQAERARLAAVQAEAAAAAEAQRRAEAEAAARAAAPPPAPAPPAVAPEPAAAVTPSPPAVTPPAPPAAAPKAAAAPKPKPKPKAKVVAKVEPPREAPEARDESLEPPPPAAFPPVRVESIRWHPLSERRVASLRFEQQNVSDAHEGDIVAGVLVYRIDPGAVELRVGSTSRVIRPVP